MGIRDTDMTQGSTWKHLILFSLPLLLGNVFQQLYNTVDSVVVGNAVGTEALAAVGTTGSVINTIVGFFMGLSSFSEENRKHQTSIAGSIINGMILVGWIGLFLMGVR